VSELMESTWQKKTGVISLVHRRSD